MRCIKNEVGLRVNDEYTFSTDVFACPKCEVGILVVGPTQEPIYDPDSKKHPIHVVKDKGQVLSW